MCRVFVEGDDSKLGFGDETPELDLHLESSTSAHMQRTILKGFVWEQCAFRYSVKCHRVCGRDCRDICYRRQTNKNEEDQTNTGDTIFNVEKTLQGEWDKTREPIGKTSLYQERLQTLKNLQLLTLT